MKKMEDWEIQSKFLQRLSAMKTAREPFERERAETELQYKSTVRRTNEWRLLVNLAIEQGLVELAVGRFAGKLNFNIEPDGEANVDELQASKYILQHYINAENFHEQKKLMRFNKAIYGTAVYYTGIQYKSSDIYEIKEDKEIDDFYDTKNYNKQKLEEYKFMWKHISLWNFYLDDRSIWNSNLHDAQDCIMVEYISKEELDNRRWDNKYFKNIKLVTESSNSTEDKSTTNINNGITPMVKVHHYWNILTKDYWIICNESILIYKGRYISKKNRLPFESAQHYPNEWFYWIGICKKVKGEKLYKTQMVQMSLDKTTMSAWINVMMWNDIEVDWQRETRPWEINVMRLTGGLDNVKPLVFDSNINDMSAMGNLMDDLIIQTTWENLKASYTSQADTLWQTEIMEENKAIRTKIVDEQDDIMISNILTACLNNITQFAPSLQLKKIKNEDWTEKIIYPAIRLTDTIAKNNWWKVVFTEDMGNFWMFEFKDNMIKNPLRVIVTTSSTGTALKGVEKNSVTQFVWNIMNIASLNPEVAQQVDRKGTVKLLQLVYWFDDKMVSTTKRWELKAKQQAQTDDLAKHLAQAPVEPQTPQAQTPEQATPPVQQMPTDLPTWLNPNGQ